MIEIYFKKLNKPNFYAKCDFKKSIIRNKQSPKKLQRLNLFIF